MWINVTSESLSLFGLEGEESKSTGDGVSNADKDITGGDLDAFELEEAAKQ